MAILLATVTNDYVRIIRSINVLIQYLQSTNKSMMISIKFLTFADTEIIFERSNIDVRSKRLSLLKRRLRQRSCCLFFTPHGFKLILKI